MSGTIAGVFITYEGTTRTLSEWSVALGLPYATVRMRYTRGERDPARLLATPKNYTSLPRTTTPSKYGAKDRKRFAASILNGLLVPAALERLNELASQRQTTPLQLAINILNNVLAPKVQDGTNEQPTGI